MRMIFYNRFRLAMPQTALIHLKVMIPRGRMTETVLNLRGLKCPLPALRTRKALKGLAPGDLLVIECTDPLADLDIPNLMRETGDTIEEANRSTELITFRIRKR
jgi:tRNA 2-thiouridine synthesizing protein A